MEQPSAPRQFQTIPHVSSQRINLKHLAVVWSTPSGEQKQLTFGALFDAIAKRACYFQQSLHVKAGDIVAVIAPRSPEYLINALALWQCGAIFLPLSDDWQEPKALASRLEQANPVAILTVRATKQQYQNELAAWLTKAHCLDALDWATVNRNQTFSAVDCPPEAPAYIYSSSGTTGKPKLIQLPHAGIDNRIDDHIKLMALEWGKDGVLCFLDFGFDASLAEMLFAMRSGNTLYIAPASTRKESVQQLPAFFQAHPITTAILVPSVLEKLPQSACGTVRKIVTMGERCYLSRLQQNGWLTHRLCAYTTAMARLKPLLVPH